MTAKQSWIVFFQKATSFKRFLSIVLFTATRAEVTKQLHETAEDLLESVK